jgi:Pretoxin HINT domain
MRPIPFLAIAFAFCVSACTEDKSTKSGGQSSANPKTTTTPEREKQSPRPPCHPGCFPAGTAIATSNGPKAIESIKTGDLVTVVGSDGVAVEKAVVSIYRTTNRLIEVQTEAGNIRTTTTQPLCLAAGGFQIAGDLKAGDTIWQWVDGKRRSVRVKAVHLTEVDAPVFNLVVGESAVFIAGGFLARGKPPASEGDSEGGAK